MKNKLLFCVFAVGIAVFAFTSCETKSPKVTDVCTDLVKESLHKSPRSLTMLVGESLAMEEYEFPGGVNDNRLIHRYMAFGNGVYQPKHVDSLTYEYGEWLDNNTSYTLRVTPKTGEPYVLTYRGNALIDPDGHVIGGEGLDNTARVEKWEKTLGTFPNTKWKGAFKGEYVMDSIFRDSIRTTFIPPMTFKYDTIKIFTGQMDTLSADTACYYTLEFDRNAATNATTGHYYSRSVRSTYNRDTKEETIVTEKIVEYDYTWYFSEISSDAKFMINLQPAAGGTGERLNISKYKVDAETNTAEFLLYGLSFTRDVNP